MAFEQIAGNEPVKELLRHTLSSGRVGHAYIFEGQRGTGKLTIAKAFAAELLKTEKPESHPDFIVVTNQLYDSSKKQENILVDTIRSMKRDIYIRPYSGQRKVYVIPRADTMQAPAQNSLLKIFEEPPEYCTIILLAENANAFLPTILSRALLLRLYPAEPEQAAEYLIREKGVEPDRAVQIAAMSGGAIGRALNMLDDETESKLRGEVFARFIALADGSYRDMYDFVRFLKQNKDNISFIFEVLLACGLDLMHIKLGNKDFRVINADRENELRKICGRLTRESAFKLNEITVKYQSIIMQNTNYPAAVLCMAMEYWEEIHDRNSRC